MQLNFIKKLRDKRYQNLIITNKEITNLFKFKKKIIFEFNGKKPVFEKFIKKNLNNNINTEKFLKDSLKKINRKKKNIYIELYKKFSVHLNLKKDYSKNMRKINNQKTKFNSYIYLGFIIKKLHLLNEIQELNFLLKLNDIIITNYSKINNLNDKIIFSNNLRREFNLLNKYC